MNIHWNYTKNCQEGIVCLNSVGKQSWATNDKKQPLVVSDKHLTAFGNAGSLTPVIGFFSRYGAFAANSGLGRSSSSWILSKRLETGKVEWGICVCLWIGPGIPYSPNGVPVRHSFFSNTPGKSQLWRKSFVIFIFFLAIFIVDDINVLMIYKIREKEKFIQRF